ncbi:oxygenase MpaB family protein [Pseudomonas sp. 10B1]|uniref:oxygenase MpaB family protein n=1 Tax=unclassified Pseudomonas TaxID=196821 RepID=UPI002B22B9CD|nr:MULTISPECIES: oxygenase MpaB family protein [unclassified Pseudomonas]MEA9978229.1 oxygenase MpaB family protein [Pseudomonas sp. RTS4]MEA9995171.1 oxygenase MpaB family protein [Pseudomonas sp. AA4]MEB0086868.1 oxygenase MpaB family protein [Pseudomonas sp. RTI1]MEB0127329.1 oxygenase MpaB family protein [Pseudomonas sp. CCC1.2]MEB0154812.1 oxygenase MpaB family protein [Pseudomonas sp. CCC4.3]
MEFIRSRIETQVMSLTGLSLGQLDLENPKGDPGLFGPQAICWQVHADFSSMLIGGISALLLQALHPLALAGVWDHSTFRQDMMGRLRRTGQFIAGTTFGSTQDANWLIEKVRTIHLQVTGTALDGRPYAASDPDLLTWVHVAEVSSFLGAHLRYRNPDLSIADQDRYYAEVASIAERLGARDIPRSRQAVADYLERMRPQLVCDERSLEVLRLLRAAPAPSRLAKPFGVLMMQAGIELLPLWACSLLGLSQHPLQRSFIRASINRSSPILRWAMRDSSVHRAHRRMGLAYK